MGRPRYRIRPRRIHVSIPEDILAELDKRFFDVARGKPLYGSYSTLVTLLLRKYLDDPTICPIEIVEEAV